MAKRIVDVLEVIKIKHHQNETAAFAFADLNGRRQTFLKQCAVRKAGQPVMMGKKLDAGFAAFTVGNIRDRPFNHGWPSPLIAHQPGIFLDPDDPAIRTAQFGFIALHNAVTQQPPGQTQAAHRVQVMLLKFVFLGQQFIDCFIAQDGNKRRVGR